MSGQARLEHSAVRIPVTLPSSKLGHSPSGERRRSVEPPPFPRYPKYSYRPISADRAIRLLRVICVDNPAFTIYASLREFALNQCPSYYALSYTWDKPAQNNNAGHSLSVPKPWQLLLVNEHEIGKSMAELRQPTSITEDTVADTLSLTPYLQHCTIGPNLRDCLGRVCNFRNWMPTVRKADNATKTPICSCEHLWIDAVCIDQSNRIEKALQIPLMGQIYSNAELVIVWLGETVQDKSFQTFVWMHSAFEDAIHEYCRRFKKDGCLDHRAIPGWRHVDPFDAAFWKTEMGLDTPDESWAHTWYYYCSFFNTNKWFARSWTMQEICLARDSVFTYGGSAMHGSNIFGLLRVIAPQWFLLLNTRGYPCYRAFHFLLENSEEEGMAAWEHRSNLVQSSTDRSHGSISTQYFWDQLILYLYQARTRQCRFAQDKVHSILGVASKSLPAGMSNPFKIDPEATPVMVYTWVTKLILRSSVNLNVLSLVVDKSTRNFDVMPSWVADLSVPSVTPLPTYGAFNATLIESNGTPKHTVDNGTLCVKGRCCGVISAISPNLGLFDLLRSASETLVRMDSIYLPTGEDRSEAFWRTLIRDHDNDEFHPTCDLHYGFTAILMAVAVRSKQSDLEQPSTAEEKRGLVSILVKRARHLCQSHLFSTTCCDEGLVLLPIASENHSRDLPRRFSEAFEAQRRQSHFFQTSNGYIGMYGPDARPMDQVLLLKGGKTPFILRENENGQYSLVRECYVHGIMQGQLINPDFEAGFGMIKIV